MGYTGMPFYPMKFGRATPRKTTATQTSRRRTTTAITAKIAQPPRSSKKSKVFPFGGTRLGCLEWGEFGRPALDAWQGARGPGRTPQAEGPPGRRL